MGPEEFHYMDKFSNQYFKNMREVRISSLYWVWDNLSSNSGSIRRETIIELIPYTSLEKLLSELVEEERYEDCVVVRDIMNLYEKHERKGLFKELF
jgi:protein-arginine kinase activator protein McsA